MEAVRFPWHLLPKDVQQLVWSFVPLDELLTNASEIFSTPEMSKHIKHRVRLLQPLRDAWVSSPMEQRNTMQYRTREARLAVRPLEFVRMERLVIGHSSLKGCLTPAIADMRKTLKVLHCDSNELDDFPIELAMCTQLRVLDATENCFKRVPECVLRLRKLRLLTFSQNIELGPEAPNDILTCLPNLTHLGFYGCALQRLPTSLISVLADDGDVEIFANVSYNNYPPGYLESYFRKYRKFRQRVGVI